MSDVAPTVIPYLTIGGRQGKAAAAFYGQAFGAELVSSLAAEDGERLLHAHLAINGGVVYFSDDFPELHGDVEAPEPTGVSIHLQVVDAQAWWDRALAAGCEVRQPLAMQFWGDLFGQVRDPFGHKWTIGGPAPATAG